MPTKWDLIDNTASVWVGEVDDPKFAGQRRIKIKLAFEKKQYAKAIPGCTWSGFDKVWHAPCSPRSMINTMESLQDSGLQIALGLGTEELVEQAKELEENANVKNASELPDFPGRTEAWLHQKQAFHFAKELDGVGLFISMGGGKSKVCVGLAEHWECTNILIACPVSVLGVWPKQFRIHGVGDYDCWISNEKMTAQRKAEQMQRFFLRPRYDKRTRVYIINYDIIYKAEFLSALKKMDLDLIIADESHKIKSPGGKASKGLYTLSKYARKVIIQTGTPMPHGPEDAYAQFRAADSDVFGTNFTLFKNKYFQMGGYEGRVIQGFIDDRAESEFSRKFGSISITITKEEMVANMKAAGMEIPGRAPDIVLTARMSPRVDRVYQTLKNELVAFIDENPTGLPTGSDYEPESWTFIENLLEDDNGELDESKFISVDNALTKMLRLRQITSGCVTTDDGEVQTIGDEKRRLLEEALDGIAPEDPVVVFAAFHHDLDVIAEVAERMGRRYGELSGRRRDALSPDSTLVDGVQVAGVQLQSGGVGIDFTLSHYNIYYSIDYNLGNYLQSGDRSDRPGQRYPVQQIHLVVETSAGKPTVDGVTYEALDKRMDLIDAVIAKSKEL